MTDQATAPPLRRNRDFLLLWSADAVSEVGTSMSTLVLPLIGYAITGSTTEAALAGTASMAATLVLRLPAGALADRWPRGRVLVLANVVSALIYGSVAGAAALHALTLTHLVLAAAAGGAAEAFVSPATSAAIRTIVAAHQRPAAYSRLQLRTHAASLVGPPAGGVLYSLARALPFLVDAVSFAAAAVAFRLIRTPLPPPDATGRSVLGDVREGAGFVARHRSVRVLMLWGAIVNLGGTLAFVAITLRLVRAGVHPAAIGLVDSVAAIAGIVGALLAPRVIARVPTGRLTIATGIAGAIAFALTGLSDDPVVVGAFLAAGTLFLPANNAGISAYLASVVPDRLQGRVNAAAGLLAGGLAPFGPVLAGVLIATAGGGAATLVGAGVFLVSIVPLVLTRSVRQLGTPDSWPEAAAG